MADEPSSEQTILQCPPQKDSTPYIKVLSSPSATQEEKPLPLEITTDPPAPSTDVEQPSAQVTKVQEASDTQSPVLKTAPSSQSAPLESKWHHLLSYISFLCDLRFMKVSTY